MSATSRVGHDCFCLFLAIIGRVATPHCMISNTSYEIVRSGQPSQRARGTPQLRHARQSKEADLRRVFDQLDTKQDKKIDADEVMDFFKKCGETVRKVRRSSML